MGEKKVDYPEKEQQMQDKQEEHEGLEFPTREALENQLLKMEEEKNEYKNKCLRIQAELQNFRRRAEIDRENVRKYGSEKLLSDLIPVVDSMIRGLESSETKDPHVKAMRKGMEMTLDILQKALQKYGVEMVDPKPGESFNPELHEAISTTSDPEKDPNTIAEVVQIGYQLNGRVLRAAMVVVVKS